MKTSVAVVSYKASLLKKLDKKEESKKAGWKVVDLKNNLIDLIWKRDLKVQDTNSIFLLSSKYTGAKYEKKINLIFSFLKENKSDMLFLQNSESLAWLLNLRGKDFDCTPILFCFSLFTINKVYIFLENKIQTEVIQQCEFVMIQFQDIIDPILFSLVLTKRNKNHI